MTTNECRLQNVFTQEEWERWCDKHPLELPPEDWERGIAMNKARELWGDLGTVCSDDLLPRLAWEIGNMKNTLRQASTWDKLFT